MEVENIPASIRHLNKILSDDPYWIKTNDDIIETFCTTTNGKQRCKVCFTDENLPIGVCMAARNVSKDIREKYVQGKYEGQYDQLIKKWEEIEGK